jgi:hypothetical protein
MLSVICLVEAQGGKGEKLVEVIVFINAFFSARDASVASLNVIFDVIQRECGGGAGV